MFSFGHLNFDAFSTIFFLILPNSNAALPFLAFVVVATIVVAAVVAAIK